MTKERTIRRATIRVRHLRRSRASTGTFEALQRMRANLLRAQSFPEALETHKSWESCCCCSTYWRGRCWPSIKAFHDAQSHLWTAFEPAPIALANTVAVGSVKNATLHFVSSRKAIREPFHTHPYWQFRERTASCPLSASSNAQRARQLTEQFNAARHPPQIAPSLVIDSPAWRHGLRRVASLGTKTWKHLGCWVPLLS